MTPEEARKLVRERARGFTPKRSTVDNAVGDDGQAEREAKARSDSDATEGWGAPANDPDEATTGLGTADIAIQVALDKPELDHVLRRFGNDWSTVGRESVIYRVTESNLGGRPVRIVAACQHSMGMVPAAILGYKTIRAWRPKMIVMTGICAGVEGKVSLGDVVVAKQCFDYGSGKIVNGVVEPDYEPQNLDDRLCSLTNSLAGERALLAAIREDWPLDTGRPLTELRLHLGAMASGAAVVADEDVVKGIREHKRSLLAIDMEAFGVARAASSSINGPLALIVKGVQDFANDQKADDYREYAAYAATALAFELLDSFWPTLPA